MEKYIFVFIIIVMLTGKGWADCDFIKVTNVRSNQFTVSWISKIDKKGWVKFGLNVNNKKNWNIAFDDREKNIKDDIHHVTIGTLKANTKYYYEIVMDEIVVGGINSQTTSNVILSRPPIGSCQPTGLIFKDSSLAEPVQDVIVYITILDDQTHSETESLLLSTKNDGRWFRELVGIKNQELNGYYQVKCGISKIHVFAQAGNNGTSEMISITTDGVDSEQPVMVLNKSSVELKHIIISLQTLAGMSKLGLLPNCMDSNCNEKVDLEDVICGLQSISVLSR
jgi:hypothetical protein